MPAGRTPFGDKDIAELYRLGVHPVLLNAFGAAAGLSCDDYRKALAGFATPERRKGRWRH
jgi:hypothetical protein